MNRMSSKQIYFDNAATSHPKPDGVYRASDAFLRSGGSPGRSAHALSLAASRMVFETRLATAKFLGLSIKSAERLIFTPGCTQSINIVLRSIKFKPGQHVLVSSLEHNAVMRPLMQLKSEKGIEVQSLPYAAGQILDLEMLENELKKPARPQLCAFMEASNVSGEMLDLPGVAQICARYEVPLLVDAAQSAGVFQARLDPAQVPVQYWCTAAHKGLYGIAGAGLLYAAPGVELDPLVHGGTGSHSDELSMPAVFPDRLEAGTMPGSAIAALGAGVEFLETTGPEQIHAHEMKLCSYFLDWLAERKNFHVAASFARQRVALVSFEIEGMDSSLVAELLDRSYGICVRAGLHCAAAAHETLGTIRRGLVRVSFSYFNTMDELETLCKALEDIDRSPRV